MKLLLDTVVFLISARAPEDLSERARNLLLDTDNELYLSVASVWEITIKYSIGKLRLTHAPDQFIPDHRSRLGAELLQLDEESVFHLMRLPLLHRDPFDRILVSQSIVHGMVLLTSDAQISRYPARTAW